MNKKLKIKKKRNLICKVLTWSFALFSTIFATFPFLTSSILSSGKARKSKITQKAKEIIDE